ncbi:hypothetical protein Ccrd_025319 [Cynara cardunculus var. scolymus]|uniref:Uncharacterized protein n=1 Tax=Cynara cardunculus var. scolymus TaxID=59895 RepID=A0A118JRV4_CYNCS|nr:hypothetical protein Ccrd_025319 [Cynara cardunculus var. scolymus]
MALKGRKLEEHRDLGYVSHRRDVIAGGGREIKQLLKEAAQRWRPYSFINEGTLGCGIGHSISPLTISIMAKIGFAELIDLCPIHATDVKLPAGGSFVIANSLTLWCATL